MCSECFYGGGEEWSPSAAVTPWDAARGNNLVEQGLAGKAGIDSSGRAGKHQRPSWSKLPRCRFLFPRGLTYERRTVPSG